MPRQNPRVKALTALPGVGQFTALVILGEIADVTRFPSVRKVASWAGLTPTVRGPALTVTGTSPGKARRGRAGSWPGGANRQLSPEFAIAYAAIARRRGKKIAATAPASCLPAPTTCSRERRPPGTPGASTRATSAARWARTATDPEVTKPPGTLAPAA